eukprot:CAMPEP_0194773912 /NCGR_PEP_ID=MMETSP0323_2-20130528/56184_1 /TAXON_ID=2866 ORGANISM="Crypthecodinium cohnii, Strain Seligo" /NCGR_SAMPLE_ID=MMETSP0323_2 /ASSEMBLY_ACC=CAM_ASM_000346 /LENGTH=61 /DNA_ID=CAMNT_0039709193 /DNA_START=39 /DNA_END=221 /DNA_ORIENTATION=-
MAFASPDDTFTFGPSRGASSLAVGGLTGPPLEGGRVMAARGTSLLCPGGALLASGPIAALT